MILKKILLAAVVSLAVSMPLMAASNSAKQDAVVYGEDKLNIAVESSAPQFVVKLKSNPTTGFAWFLREYNTDIIAPVKHYYQAPDSKLVGAPGFEYWVFKIKPAGFVVPQQTSLRFLYARPWQGAENATQVMFRVSTLS